VFGSLFNKLQEVKLSDLNHELGKAKESIAYGSSSYLQHFKEDATAVGSIIRSESTRFGDYFGRIKPGLPKSTSLPVIQGKETVGGCTPCTRVLSGKYKYRSTVESPDEPIVSPTDLIDQDSVVSRFIKVVGSQDTTAKTTAAEKKERKTSTREDIRKKLASFHDPEVDNKEVGNNNLEICFINETAIEDERTLVEEDEETAQINPLAEESESEEDDPEDTEESSAIFPRSKSDWEAFRNPEVCLGGLEEQRAEVQQERLQRIKDKEEKKRRKYQRAARIALAQCGQIARRQILVEIERRAESSTISKIIGLQHSELNEENIQLFNVAKLQVILNDLQGSIESFNTELVNHLISKDELQSEQESMLIDIEDISQPR